MRKKYFYCRIPMNLQIFAEGGAGDGAGADGGNGGGVSGDKIDYMLELRVSLQNIRSQNRA